MSVIESFPPKSETITIGNKVPDREKPLKEHIAEVRDMITIALGVMKELKAQAVLKYNAPGMRFLIGEIIGCLSRAKSAASIDVDQLNFRKL